MLLHRNGGHKQLEIIYIYISIITPKLIIIFHFSILLHPVRWQRFRLKVNQWEFVYCRVDRCFQFEHCLPACWQNVCVVCWSMTLSACSICEAARRNTFPAETALLQSCNLKWSKYCCSLLSNSLLCWQMNVCGLGKYGSFSVNPLRFEWITDLTTRWQNLNQSNWKWGFFCNNFHAFLPRQVSLNLQS